MAVLTLKIVDNQLFVHGIADDGTIVLVPLNFAVWEPGGLTINNTNQAMNVLAERIRAALNRDNAALTAVP